MIDLRLNTFVTIQVHTSRFLIWSGAWLRYKTCVVVWILFGGEGHKWRLHRIVGMLAVEDRDSRASIISLHMVLLHKQLLMIPNKAESHHWLYRIQVGFRQKLILNPHPKSSTRILSSITSEQMDKQQAALELVLMQTSQQSNKTSSVQQAQMAQLLALLFNLKQKNQVEMSTRKATALRCHVYQAEESSDPVSYRRTLNVINMQTIQISKMPKTSQLNNRH